MASTMARTGSGWSECGQVQRALAAATLGGLGDDRQQAL
jgi:hypothetical protein